MNDPHQYAERNIKKLSKFLSLVLRHQPEQIGIKLDEGGWADVDQLLMQAAKHGAAIDFDLLKHIVYTNDKKRFAFSADMQKIRASQGHSVEVELGYRPQQPPDVLFHGTGEKSVESILKTGLKKRSRQHVHLSADIETAIKVGQRHGKPVIFKVSAGEMHHAGHLFYISENGVWLTDVVPVEFLAKYVQ